jgi:hypothetical protein
MIVAMELVVVDSSWPLYKRVFVWVKLLRVWGGLRFDDSLHIAPADLVLRKGGLEARITSTKTTGPGKRVEVLYAFVSNDAYLVSQAWLEVGFRLLEGGAGHIARDYLLPLPSTDCLGFRASPAVYADSLAMTRALLRELPLLGVSGPFGAEVCVLTDEPALSSAAALYWSEHGDRALLVSWGACLGLPRETLDAIGRWGPSGSEQYVRTNRALVVAAQSAIAGAVRGGESLHLFDETGLLEGLVAHLTARGFSEGDALAQAEVLRLPGYAASDAAAAAPANDAAAAAEAFCVGPVGGRSAEERYAEPDTFKDGTLVVSLSVRSGLRCLHKVGGCWRRPGVDYQRFQVLSLPPTPDDYHRLCQSCWPGVAAWGPDAEKTTALGTEADQEERALRAAEIGSPSTSSSSTSGSEAED